MKKVKLDTKDIKVTPALINTLTHICNTDSNVDFNKITVFKNHISISFNWVKDGNTDSIFNKLNSKLKLF